MNESIRRAIDLSSHNLFNTNEEQEKLDEIQTVQQTTWHKVPLTMCQSKQGSQKQTDTKIVSTQFSMVKEENRLGSKMKFMQTFSKNREHVSETLEHIQQTVNNTWTRLNNALLFGLLIYKPVCQVNQRHALLNV